MNIKEFIGEAVGTFIIVLIGCGCVATAVLFQAPATLGMVALIWTIGVSLAIFATRSFSPAHLNPAVSAGFLIRKEIKPNQFAFYTIAQFTGAIIASILIYLFFESDISVFEETRHIIRSSKTAQNSAMMFGEYFPNPGYPNLKVTLLEAISFEAIGVFILMSVILGTSLIGWKWRHISPILIGSTVGILIYFIAPYTQAGFNPARDLGPRMMSYLFGWEESAFQNGNLDSILVYVVGPLLGASTAVLLSRVWLKKLTTLVKPEDSKG